ncbi:ROK family transcriptional regulator [Streptomyces tubbatahanensis]|uniref:ROK family transcriptional regulator n=1 Tax=Streptomyces tubbatahanensis TaxID=2923272 RepID=A0ABY3XLP5_9ACTN|nr:ROK family transcriptional regulator [Streptomyces tubbatahanensis]UNS95331.1 ROK family transcriptional regulator [Streptomyces tubbatahanensis]
MWEPVRLTWPSVSGRVDSDTVRSSLARLIASGAADSRVALVRATGLSRTSVNTHLDQLLEAGVVAESGRAPVAGRGRPAHRLALAARPGVILVADVGAHAARLAVTDLGQNLLASRQISFDVGQGPQQGLKALGDQLAELLTEAGLSPDEVRWLSVGLPGPVDSHMGRPVRPPIMPGWDGFPVGDQLGERFSCSVLVDNDVNLMALGEARALPPEASPLLYIKIGTGIGGGLVTDEGQPHRGADGAAGDIGHVRVPGAGDVVCVCGNVGCVEAVSSAAAVLSQLRERQPALRGIEDLADRLRAGDADAVRAVRAAAEPLGEVVATLVHFYNPRTVLLGGLVSTASDDMLAGIRGVVYRRALPLATRNLSLTHSRLGQFAGVAGGAVAGIERVLSPQSVGELLAPRPSPTSEAASVTG